MDVEYIKLMLYSPDYEIRQHTYAMMGTINELIDAGQKEELRNILSGFVVNEMFSDTTECLMIEKAKEALDLL